MGDLIFDPSNPLKLRRVPNHNGSDDEEDAQNEEDVLLGQDIDGNQRRKRQKFKSVDVTQYNNDSSDEDYIDKVKDSKPNSKDAEGDSDSDMFSSDNEDSTKSEEKVPEVKGVKLLDVDEFEEEIGVNESKTLQNDSNEEGLADTENPEEEDEEDEEQDIEYYNNIENADQRNHKAKNEPKIDSFNLKNEQREGRFDEDGNFLAVEASDEENADTWLDSFKKKDITRARKAQEQRQRLEAKRQLEEIINGLSLEDCLYKLISLLEPVESPLEALQRLNKKPKSKKSNKKTDEELQLEKIRKQNVIDITEYSEALIERGISDPYSLEREDLMLKYKEETGNNYRKPTTDTVDKSAVSNSNEEEKIWEFRWLGDSEIHGFYTQHEILYWKDHYFEKRAEVRKKGQSEFTHIDEISKAL